MTSTENRMKALALFLETGDTDDITDEGNNSFSYTSQEYLVLTDNEADEATLDYVRESAWAFDTSFIRAHSHVSMPDKGWDALTSMKEKLCEDANDLVLALIKDVKHFARDAANCDGRGHFLAGYDGEENEATIDGVTYYIYRTN